MVDEAIRLADDVLHDPRRTQMKGIFSGLRSDGTALQWDGGLLCIGEVQNMGLNQFTLRPWVFTPGEGFKPPRNDNELTVVMMSHLPFRSDVSTKSVIVCVGNGAIKSSDTIHFFKDSYILPRPEFEPSLAWDVTHLFCGAYGGWTMAANWLAKNEKCFTIDKEIFVDCDEMVMETWSKNHGAGFYRLPLTKVHVWNNQKKLALHGEVSDTAMLYAVSSLANHLATVSPPCVSWSRGGKAQGLHTEQGWAFVESITMCVRMQVVALCLECADEFKTHPHAALVEKLLILAGYRRVWDQVCQLHQLADCFRNRWLAVWVRAASWASEVYLPPSMTEQLVLSPSELQVYANADYLPPNKRCKNGVPMEFEKVLGARKPDPQQPLPTLCAMYTSQHKLNSSHLKEKGIFASVTTCDKQVRFIDPVRWVAILGAGETIHFPSKLGLAFHQIGNAIAVPHAMLCFLVLFQATSKYDASIRDVINRLWASRHMKHTSILLEGVEFWTLIKLDAFASHLDTPARPQAFGFSEALGLTRLCIQNAAKDGAHVIEVPEQWSIVQLLTQVLHIDHHVLKEVTISNSNHAANKNHRVATIAETKTLWTISLRNVNIGHLCVSPQPFDESAIPPTVPFDLSDNIEDSSDPHLSVSVPTFDQILHTASFARFLSILEQFYAGSVVLTPSDAKQTVTIGVTEALFATRVPLKTGMQFEQVRHIASQLHPHCEHVEIVIPQVPLQEPVRYPVYLLQANKPASGKTHVFLQVRPPCNELFVVLVPDVITVGTVLHFHGHAHRIVMHNAALIGNHASIYLKTADILTIDRISSEARILSGGHPHAQEKPSLPCMVDFTTRCEHATNTNGWLASDEFHFCMKRLTSQAKHAPEYVGIALWDRQTNEILESDHGHLQSIKQGRTNLPILCEAHWIGAELDIGAKVTKVTLVGLPQDLESQIVDAFARFLDVLPASIQAQVYPLNMIPDMCGWQVLVKWFSDCGVHLAYPLRRSSMRYFTAHCKIGKMQPVMKS